MIGLDEVAECSTATIHQLILRLFTLDGRLRQAKRLLNSSDSKKDYGRAAVYLSLLAIIDFIDSFADMSEENLSQPLMYLSRSLFDLSQGQRANIFEPKKMMHRPGASQAQAAFRSYTAAAMQIYMDAGLKKQDAARCVARAVSRELPSGISLTPEQIIRSRDNVIGAYERGYAKERFEGVLSGVERSDCVPSGQFEKAFILGLKVALPELWFAKIEDEEGAVPPAVSNKFKGNLDKPTS
jgi:hypothetical protein